MQELLKIYWEIWTLKITCQLWKLFCLKWDKLSDELTYWIYITTYLKIFGAVFYVSISEILGRYQDSISDSSSHSAVPQWFIVRNIFRSILLIKEECERKVKVLNKGNLSSLSPSFSFLIRISGPENSTWLYESKFSTNVILRK